MGKLKGALIGYGFILSKGHVPAYLERQKKGELEIVAVADVCEGRRALVPQAFPDAQVYTDYEILLEQEGDRLDFVDIATPPAFHAEIAMAALDRGIHVLCEKPLTTTLEEARALLQKAKDCQRVIFPCHNYKHAPVVKAIREELDSGRIGKVTDLTLTTFRNTHAKGVTEWDTHWRRKNQYSGGGIAMDHGSHTFYLTFDWFGEYPTAISAKMRNQSEGQYDTEDNFSAVLTFPSGTATVHLSWTAGVRKVIYTLQGKHGALTVMDDEWERALMEATDGPDVAQGAVRWNFDRRSIASHWMDASHVQWFQSLFDQFIVAMRRGDCVGKEAKEAYLCVQLITQAYESARQGCRELPLATDLQLT